MIIYKATNLINKKVYIGQTTNTLEYRKDQHKRETKSVRKKNSYFHNAIAKYGFDNFDFGIIDKADSLDELNKKEIYWIKHYNSTNKDIGYNLDSGGLNCFKSESTKIKIGLTTKEKWNNPNIASKMLNGLRKGTDVFSQKCYENRVIFICPICKTELLLPKHIAENKKYCCIECASKDGFYIKGITSAIEQIKINNNILKDEISIFILKWSINNENIIINCPYNKISSTLKELFELINNKYNIKDFRSLYKCFDVKSKKEFLQYLKDYVIKENVC